MPEILALAIITAVLLLAALVGMLGSRPLLAWYLREVRGMKLKQLAVTTGLSDAFVSRLERGQVSSSVANLMWTAPHLSGL